MQYFGGKQRIAKNVTDILNQFATCRGHYVEPFVGAASILSKVKHANRIASDSNLALISMWKALSSGWTPPETISEETYRQLSASKDQNNPLTAFAGFGCSFAGKWFGGYARGDENRNYAANAASSLREKLKTLGDVDWRCGDYRHLTYPKDSLIYCDPPYQGTTQYGGAQEPFEWRSFWEFCRDKSREGHLVFVSEYAAPSDFCCVSEIKTKLDIRDANNAKQLRTEKLFTWFA